MHVSIWIFLIIAIHNGPGPNLGELFTPTVAHHPLRVHLQQPLRSTRTHGLWRGWYDRQPMHWVDYGLRWYGTPRSLVKNSTWDQTLGLCVSLQPTLGAQLSFPRAYPDIGRFLNRAHICVYVPTATWSQVQELVQGKPPNFTMHSCWNAHQQLSFSAIIGYLDAVSAAYRLSPCSWALGHSVGTRHGFFA